MDNICRGVKRNNKRCVRNIDSGEEYCWQHRNQSYNRGRSRSRDIINESYNRGRSRSRDISMVNNQLVIRNDDIILDLEKYTNNGLMIESIMLFCKDIIELEPNEVNERIIFIQYHMSNLLYVLDQKKKLTIENQIYCYIILQLVYLYLSNRISKSDVSNKLIRYIEYIKQDRKIQNSKLENIIRFLLSKGIQLSKAFTLYKLKGSCY
jgi:hypothetical protein